MLVECSSAALWPSVNVRCDVIAYVSVDLGYSVLFNSKYQDRMPTILAVLPNNINGLVVF